MMMGKHIPFSFLEIANGCRTLHIMSAAFPACPDPTRSSPKPSTHAGGFDGIMIVASTFVVRDLVLKFLEISGKVGLFDNISVAFVETRITFVA
jgi:hypothetical protein